jgi:hypothetical protein
MERELWPRLCHLVMTTGRSIRQVNVTSSFGGGLGPLPAWVRRQRRVGRRVWAKLLINGVRVMKNQELTFHMQ